MTQIEETKKGRGGARPNSGAKSLGIETITIRIDKRLEPLMNTVKSEFKSGRLTISDIEQLNSQSGKPNRHDDKKPGHDEKKLLKKIADLEYSRDEFRDLYRRMSDMYDESYISHQDEIKKLKLALEETRFIYEMYEMYRKGIKNGINGKLKKRLIQFCHPDKYPDGKIKAIATELTSELNKLSSLD